MTKIDIAVELIKCNGYCGLSRMNINCKDCCCTVIQDDTCSVSESRRCAKDYFMQHMDELSPEQSVAIMELLI